MMSTETPTAAPHSLLDFRPTWLRLMVDRYGEPDFYQCPERGMPMRQTWRWFIAAGTSDVLVAANYDPDGTKVLVQVEGDAPVTVHATFPDQSPRLGSNRVLPLLQFAGLLSAGDVA